MSFSILWPSHLTAIGGDSVFWLPTINDNMRLLDDALTPSVALLPTLGVLRPNRLVSLGRDDTGYKVQESVKALGVVGVAAGHTDDYGFTLIKLYGCAVVETAADVTVADVGKLAVYGPGGTVSVTSMPPDDYDSWVGLVVGVARHRMARVLLRYFGEHALAPACGYMQNSIRRYGPIGAVSRVPDAEVAASSYSESHVFFTYLGVYDNDHPELFNVAVPGVGTGHGSCEDAANFEVSAGKIVQGTSGSVLTLHLERGYEAAVGSAYIVDSSETGGVGVRLRCDVQGQIVTLTLGSGTWQGQGVRQVHVNVTGVLAEG